MKWKSITWRYRIIKNHLYKNNIDGFNFNLSDMQEDNYLLWISTITNWSKYKRTEKKTILESQSSNTCTNNMNFNRNNSYAKALWFMIFKYNWRSRVYRFGVFSIIRKRRQKNNSKVLNRITSYYAKSSKYNLFST